MAAARNLVVVHTPSGAAQYVASVIDRQPIEGVLGTIAANANAAIATLSQQGDVEVWARATDQAGNVSDVAKARIPDGVKVSTNAFHIPASKGLIYGCHGDRVALRRFDIGFDPTP